MSIPVDHKYRWLLNLLMENDRLTFEEIAEKWYKYSEGERLNKRTFHNWRDGIVLTFGTIIDCDKKGGYS